MIQQIKIGSLVKQTEEVIKGRGHSSFALGLVLGVLRAGESHTGRLLKIQKIGQGTYPTDITSVPDYECNLVVVE